MKVFIARGDHYSVPGHRLRAHGSMQGAKASALKFLNIIRKELDLPEAKRFSSAGVIVCQRKLVDAGDDGTCDVWIETLEVLP